MKFLKLEKYDNFILSKFKGAKYRYFFLMLPHRIIGVGILILLVVIKWIPLSFAILIAIFSFAISYANKKYSDPTSHNADK